MAKETTLVYVTKIQRGLERIPERRSRLQRSAKRLRSEKDAQDLHLRTADMAEDLMTVASKKETAT